MNWNKMSCQKYVLSTFEPEFIAILELLVKFVSQICHENINKPLGGAYLAYFGIDINPGQRKTRQKLDHISSNLTTLLHTGTAKRLKRTDFDYKKILQLK